jgi:hypothetical protein
VDGSSEHGNELSGSATGGFSRRAQLHGVSSVVVRASFLVFYLDVYTGLR